MKKINADFQFNFLGLRFRVNIPMSEHLRTQRRLNLHALFLCFLNRKKFVAFHLELPTFQKLLNALKE
jgi:hypothetical protein